MFRIDWKHKMRMGLITVFIVCLAIACSRQVERHDIDQDVHDVDKLVPVLMSASHG